MLKIYFITYDDPSGSMHTPPTHTIDEGGLSMASILGRLTAMEGRLMAVQESNTELQERNTELWERLTIVEESNTELQESNTKLRVELRENNDRLGATMQTTMEAVMGVCDVGYIYIIRLCRFRIALPSTRCETEFFLTRLGISWPSSAVIRIGGIGRAMLTGMQCFLRR